MRTRPAPTAFVLLAALAAGVSIAVLAAAPVAAASHRLSQGQPWSDVGRVPDVPVYSIESPFVSPDGRFAIYVHDAETDGAYELWSAPLAGGAPVRLSGLLPAGEYARVHGFTPDGTRVLYSAHQESLGWTDLFAAPVDGSSGALRINAPIALDRFAWPLGVSPDSTRVAYAVCNQASEGSSCWELWIAGIDGGAPLRLLAAESGDRLIVPEVTSDFEHVVYLVDDDVLFADEIWSIATAGGQPVRLNGAMAAAGNVVSFALAFAGDRVAYVADQQTDEVFEAYVVGVAGGGAVKISAPLPAGYDVFTLHSGFSLDDERFLYLRTWPSGSGERDLWSAATDGSGAVQVSPPVVAGGFVWQLAPAAGDRVVWIGDQETDEVYEMYSAPVTGGAMTKLSGTMVAGGEVLGWSLSPDGGRLLYRADQEVNGRDELWSVPVAGGVPTRLNARPVAAGAEWDVEAAWWSADSSRVVYRSSERGCAACPPLGRLWSAPAAPPGAAGAVRLDACEGLFEHVLGPVAVSPTDAKQAVYIADQEVDGRFDLYLGDTCLYCDGFEAGSPLRWSVVAP